MATPLPTTSPLPILGDLALDVMLNGYRWQLGADRTIDWSMSDGFNGEAWIDVNAAATYVDTALDIISYYANVTFNYMGVFSNPAMANAGGSEMNFSMSQVGRLFTSTDQYALGYFPTTSGEPYLGAAGDVYLNIDSPANTMSYEPGGVGWTVLLHEIGHALGLKHPHNTGAGGQPTFNYTGLGDLDDNWITVMSYSDDYPYNQIAWHPASPMILDVLALQYLYGANMRTNAGDSVFLLKNNNLFLTLWDASGWDVLDLSQATSGWTLEMPEFLVSDIITSPVGWAAPSNEVNLATPHSLYWLLGDYEEVQGSAFGDQIIGDSLSNRILGNGGNDTISDVGGSNYLRGGAGDDSLSGGDGFDDVHGNEGNDTVAGALGNDWVVGGKDNDLQFGGDGFDVVYGNLGSDTLNGDAGNDWVRGGQQNDVLNGGAGDDWLSGDRDNDTITGGSGADLFNLFSGAGADRITDFSLAEGDRVRWEGGLPTYTIAQVGADTVISYGASDQVTLVGISAATLTASGWFVVA